MRAHDQLVKAMLRKPGVKAEVERIELEEGELLDALLKARLEAGLTQAQVAERMGTQAGDWKAFALGCNTAQVRACLWQEFGAAIGAAQPLAARSMIRPQPSRFALKPAACKQRSPHPHKSTNTRATTFVARRRSSSSMCSSARLAWLSSTVRGPQP
jgi:hypothetical protein